MTTITGQQFKTAVIGLSEQEIHVGYLERTVRTALLDKTAGQDNLNSK
jgi:hypothetical protein